jgi:hypothetical protein
MNLVALGKTFVLVCLTAALAVPQERVFSGSGFSAEQQQTPQRQPLPQSPNEYVQQALDHELAAQDGDHTHWRYHFHREDEKNNYDRDVIETSEGSLARTLLLWGRPLTADERQQDEERMHKLVADAAERAKRAKREKEDDEKVVKMLKAIPKAFIFKYEGEENGVVRLSFVPSPHFDPPSLELRIFRSLNGTLYIDRAQNRLAGVEGTLFEDVNFGWGLLGRLYKGGTFKVVQKDMGNGHWEVASEEVNMIGRAVLFKTITRKQKEVRTDFRQVSPSMTMTQALEILEKDVGSVSVSNSHTASQPQGKN